MVRSVVTIVASSDPACRSTTTVISPRGQIHRFARFAGSGIPADHDPVDRDVDVQRVELRISGFHGRQDPAPVRVLAEHRTLE